MHKWLQGSAQTQKSVFLRTFYFSASRISILVFPSGVAEGSPLTWWAREAWAKEAMWALGCYRRGNFPVPIAGPNVPRGGTVGCKTATANHLNLAVSRKLEGKRGSDKPVQGCHPLTKQRKLKWLFLQRVGLSRQVQTRSARGRPTNTWPAVVGFVLFFLANPHVPFTGSAFYLIRGSTLKEVRLESPRNCQAPPLLCDSTRQLREKVPWSKREPGRQA